MFNKIVASPILVRVIPFAVFAILTMFQGRFGEASQYWIYALKTVIGAWLLWQVRHYVKEMKWSFSWEAVAMGVGVFVAWVGLDGYYPMLSARSGGICGAAPILPMRSPFSVTASGSTSSRMAVRPVKSVSASTVKVSYVGLTPVNKMD